jgi:catechol 2,3-dioxygenase-like lactoylglutathione lyase family enzyme
MDPMTGSRMEAAKLPGVTGFDHMVILVRDIDAAARLYAALGFQLTARGHHTRGTCNHTMMLDGNYLELIAVEHPNESTAAYLAQLEKAEGAQAIGLATRDADDVHRELAAAGLAVTPVVAFSRDVAVPEGSRKASFRACRFPEIADLPGLFCCEHLTRDVVWRPEWQRHPNGASRVVGVTLIHADPARAAAAWRGVFGGEADGTRAMLGAVAVDFVTRDEAAERFGGIGFSEARGDGFIAGATIAVGSVRAVEALLAETGVASRTTEAGGIVAVTDFTCGTLIEFVERVD